MEITAAAATGTAPRSAEIALAHDRDNPFPGLRPFEPEEAYLFFGREEHTQELLRKLRRNRFLAVVGTSGSGKSSLVRAGLLPALAGGKLSGAGSGWRVALFRPGSDPIGELARALVRPAVLGDVSETANDDHARLQATLAETTLRRSALGIIEAVRQARLPVGENVLVVVDQFEEVFRFKRETEGRHGSEDAAAFVKLLLEASRSSAPSVYVVLTMRSDYLGDCAQFRDLPEAINEGQYLIPRLTRDQRRETITGPIDRAGGAITPRLVQRLLNDVGDDPDQLPILQHALMRTWDRWSAVRKDSEPLDIEHYDSVGRMASALSRHADEVYDTLPDERAHRIAERLFKALTDKGEDGRGIRRATPLDRLCKVAEADLAEVEPVVEAFRRPGCSFLMPPADTPLGPDTVIDISHESLMRVWERLRHWVDQELESGHMYHRLAETAVLHREHKARLWDDPDLSQALAWRQRERPNEAWAQRYHHEFTTAMAFLDESDRTARQRRKQRRNWTIGGLVLLASVAIVMALLWAKAQHSLNQVQVFVDTDKIERFKETILEDKCNLLFDPEQEQCKAALELAGELGKSLPGHQKTLQGLEKEDKGKGKDERKAGRQSEMTQRLVQDLEMIQKVTPRTMMKDHEQEWQNAIEAIKQDPRYQDVAFKPVGGLLPLGQDPQSRLWEFAHVPSGTVPQRDADGKLQLSADTGMVLVLIPGGSFEMGSEAGESDERPVHTVTVPPFFLSKYELTQGQWRRLAGKNNSVFQGDDLRPVESVSFDEARTACGWPGLRLPSEAEWEYAARSGGKEEKWAGTSEEAELEHYAWYWENSGQKTHPIGEKQPNGLGLHDMSGNVWEWVQDCYHGSYEGAPKDGSAWEAADCNLRVVRGGWNLNAVLLRASLRSRDRPWPPVRLPGVPVCGPSPQVVYYLNSNNLKSDERLAALVRFL